MIPTRTFAKAVTLLKHNFKYTAVVSWADDLETRSILFTSKCSTAARFSTVKDKCNHSSFRRRSALESAVFQYCMKDYGFEQISVAVNVAHNLRQCCCPFGLLPKWSPELITPWWSLLSAETGNVLIGSDLLAASCEPLHNRTYSSIPIELISLIPSSFP